MVIHVTLRDAFGTDIAAGDLVSTGAADDEQIRGWLSARPNFPLQHSTPNPLFPLEMVVRFDG